MKQRHSIKKTTAATGPEGTGSNETPVSREVTPWGGEDFQNKENNEGIITGIPVVAQS